MTKKQSNFGLLVIAVIGAGMLTSCASSLKEYNPKMGLLDELVLLDPAHGTSRGGSDTSIETEESEDVSQNNVRPAVAVDDGPQATPVTAKTFKNVSMTWPLKNVQITSPYGKRGREFHEGVDLRAAVGTPVYAAHAGHVLYAGGKLHGYGNMIVIKHSSGIATIYAHNSKLVVRRGQWVRQGTLIAYTGNTGHSHGPHLHFEIRDGVKTVNPMKLLPKPSSLQSMPTAKHMSGAGKLLAG